MHCQAEFGGILSLLAQLGQEFTNVLQHILVALLYLQAVSMDVDLGHGVTADVDVLYLLWCNVFSLSKFKYMLLPINDFECPILLGERNEGFQRGYLTTTAHKVHSKHTAAYMARKRLTEHLSFFCQNSA